MLISTTQYLDGLTIIRFKARRLRADTLRFVDGACDQSKRHGRHGILLDFADVKSARMSTIGALIELICRHPKLEFAFCSLNNKISNLITSSGMDRHLRIYTSKAAALRSEQFRPHYLTSTRAILNLPKASTQISEATGNALLAELDILGRPLIEHFLANLSSFGIKEALFCVRPQEIAKLKRLLTQMDHGMCLFYIPCEPSDAKLGPNALNLGSPRIQETLRYNVSGSELALYTSVDRLERLNAQAIERNFEPAIVRGETCSQETLPETQSTWTGYHFLTAEQVLGVKPPGRANIVPIGKGSHTNSLVQSPSFQSNRRLQSLEDYFLTLRLASKRVTTPLSPKGEEIAQEIWRGKGAEISPRARITGFCHVGENAIVEPQAALKCFNIIGPFASVARRTLIDECLVLPRAQTSANLTYQKCFIGRGKAHSIDIQPNTRPTPKPQRQPIAFHQASLGAA